MGTPFPTGGRVFELPNQTGQRPPNIQKDFVSLYVEAARIPKTSGWFLSDTSLALSFKVVASYLTSAGNLGGNTTTSITVTKTYSFDVTRDASGNVVLPLRSLAIVDNCPLMTKAPAGDTFLSDLTTSLTFLSTRDSTGFTIALQEIFKLSSKLPIPNPYTPYVSLLGDGVSDVIQTIQKQDANPQPLSNIGFQFVGDQAAQSGYNVLLMSTDEQIGGGYVDIDNLDRTLLGYDSALGLTYNKKTCQNAYVIFRLGYNNNPLAPASVKTAGFKPGLKPTGKGLLASVGLGENKLLANL
jgi:hypothetical protein